MKTSNLARAVLIVAVLNLAYFGIEFAVALRIESASLLADAVDFLEDAAVNFLIILGLGWSAANRARLGQLLALILLAPALASGEDPAQVWADHPIKEPAVSVAPFRDRKAQPDDLLELANATVNDAAWIARAKAVMIAAADV